MAIKKVELLVCDNCNCISTGNPEEKVPCMECGETMARVEFVRQPTPLALDAAKPCQYCKHVHDSSLACPEYAANTPRK